MKCANCGAELRTGCVYCSVCGAEAQIVSDYNLLEDDFLRGLLQEKKKKIQSHKASGNGKQKTAGKSKSAPSGKTKSGRKKKYPTWAVLALVILAVLLAGIVLLVTYARSNSYEYQMKKADDYQSRNDYRKAEKYLRRALKLQTDSLDARMRLAEIFLAQEQNDSARKFLLEVLKLDEDYSAAYEQLIQIYAEQQNYGAIQKLSGQVTDEDILELFDEYLPKPPRSDPKGGIYQGETFVELTGEGDCEIYYTTDGTDPVQGRKYHTPILMEPGKNTRLRAVARNQFGLYSQETEEVFQIKKQKPNPPQVAPYGGNFYTPETIVVHIPEGCTVYYTWDDTVPTQESQQYKEPIPIPEGNNVLSLILVDKDDMVSDVLRCNYIYMPE